ncbi:helix-turn-helix transcriptional regulator [Variovorax sp. 2RAF20]
MQAAPITKPQAVRSKHSTTKPLPPGAKRGHVDPHPPRRKRGTVNPQPLHVAQIAEALLVMRTVSALTGFSAATIYRKLALGAFPLPVRFGARCTRWRAGDVTAWLSAQAEA